MATYRNGQIPSSALTTISGGARVIKGTANAFSRAQSAAKKEGITLSTFGEYAGYRSRAIQAAMRAAFLSRNIAEMRKYNMSTTSTATPAAPGYSPHGDGLAIDVKTGASYARVKAILAKYGFKAPFTGDPWHFVHDGKTATSTIVAAVVKATSTAPKSVKVSYKIVSGDTLGKIAAKLQKKYPKTKPALTWQAIYKENRAIIGSNPNVIDPRMKKLTITVKK